MSLCRIAEQRMGDSSAEQALALSCSPAAAGFFKGGAFAQKMAVNWTLHVNCLRGNLEEVRNSLENDGADPNSVREVGSTFTCLMVAA